MMAGFGFGFFSILIIIAFWVFVIYMIIHVVNLMKEHNRYLREIRDELRKDNQSQNESTGEPK
ncbi:autophagy-related protein 27 [Sporolactobacillus kofuensis]|uniref:Autophagy-related protein 27 n=1 Tax=Sporolactobacillus kofuensis TaxID=269672 RepID=A0ABW1WIA2_9BACL|nr:autophagy-related protein 27 [Sporolactobacillus kofuensis]MCO7176231.1 autophagy-related protein 27 [Sporolactobacillus kofuensis]